jgi:predicted ABC-type ATPase
VPELIIIAGPNGAGKTTFANEYLKERSDFVFVNADEIRRELAEPPFGEAQRDVYAGRLMIKQINALAVARRNFTCETTLASLAYAKKIRVWRQLGYSVALTYLRLPSADISVQRVRKRVAAGGHGIPEDVLRRRFDKSFRYFEQIYKPIVDEWELWDSLEREFRLVDRGAWNALGT